jgi:hypothetical protein
VPATGTARSGAPLCCRRADEAACIDAAFERILPEARADGLKVSASRYVDANLTLFGAGAFDLAASAFATVTEARRAVAA